MNVNAHGAPAPASGTCGLCSWLPRWQAPGAGGAPGDIGTDVLLECESGRSRDLCIVAALRTPLVQCVGEGFSLTCRPASALWRMAVSMHRVGDLRFAGSCVARHEDRVAQLRRYREGGGARRWRLTIPGAASLEGLFSVTRLHITPLFHGTNRPMMELRAEEPVALLVTPAH